MKEIYFATELFRQNWLNILDLSFYMFAFLLFFIFPLLWLFYFLSEKRGKKFTRLSVQLGIIGGIILLSLIIGTAVRLRNAYGDFNKLTTDGNKYIATHTIKFWKENSFDKSQVKEAYVNYTYLMTHRRDEGFFIRIIFNDGSEMKSDFIRYPKPLTIYYNEAKAHADSLLTLTGLTGDNPPAEVYPR